MNKLMCTLPVFKNTECSYVPPIVKNILARKNKKGQLQIKVNGKGKWVNAEYNEESKMLQWLQ